MRLDGVTGLRARAVDPKGCFYSVGSAGLQPPEHLDVAVVDNREITDCATGRNRVDRRGGRLRGPDEILVGPHPRRALNRHMRNAVETVLRAETAVNGNVDDLG